MSASASGLACSATRPRAETERTVTSAARGPPRARARALATAASFSWQPLETMKHCTNDGGGVISFQDTAALFLFVVLEFLGKLSILLDGVRGTPHRVQFPAPGLFSDLSTVSLFMGLFKAVIRSLGPSLQLSPMIFPRSLSL